MFARGLVQVMESEADRWSGSTASPGPYQPTSPSFFVDSALPSDDHHSSEEELEVINSSQPVAVACRASSVTVPEKRKWSQITADHRHAATIAASVSCGNLAPSGGAAASAAARPAPATPCPAAAAAAAAASAPSHDHSCGSSDEEVQGLLSAPVQFRTSPPLDARKPGRSLSPPPKLFHLCSAAAAAADVSPRKRHRHTPRPRPCLDFEKMQQLKARSVTAWRHGGDHGGGERSVFCW
ncbi:uncharacterized protein LOC134542423 isoform X2 [Bacillus rossius redtenbacheri]|uniref:uncharacterized protein LOC134542423 isoform X2 n=1 Tax=Bacillus rossius redtenbacheri TaxID=93214 RepID=UPI002FDC9315